MLAFISLFQSKMDKEISVKCISTELDYTEFIWSPNCYFYHFQPNFTNNNLIMSKHI